MATSNKSKKILEKARKVAAKTKKKKVSKVDVKKKTTSYPEGQNAPQSKRYTQEADKSLGAKNTGWRWTKEGAKKLGKDANAKPSQSDIETYRNETFKLKGKPNKSGPKGVGDGSHRYLYIERRADKADLKRNQKLAKGGETKDAWGVFYNGKLMFTESSQEEANKSAKMLKSQVDMPFGVSVEKVESKKHAKGGTIEWSNDENEQLGNWLMKTKDGKEILEKSQNSTELEKNVRAYVKKHGEVAGLEIDNEDEGLEWVTFDDLMREIKSRYAKGGYMANGGVVSKQNVQKLLKAVEKDWGQGSELYGDLQESIVGWMNREGELNPQGVAAVKHLLYNWDCYDEYEKYLNSSYAKGGITKDELKNFKSYVKEFYGNDGMYDKFFPPTGASNDEIELAIRMYVSYCKTKDDQWAGGDPFDVEIVRDVMLYNRGQKTKLEYQRAVKEIVKHYNNKSFEYGGILQPMIGGGNADPRFDIYNTTMFAKKGAELPKGGESKRYLNYYEIYDEGTGKSLNIQAHSFEEAEEIASTIEFENFRDGEDIEFGEMAKGGETKEGKIVKRRYLQGRGKNVFTFGYGMPKDAIDIFGTKGGTEYFIMPNGKVYKKTKENMNLFEFIGKQDDYAKGGEMARGGVFEVGRFYKAKDGKNYRFLGSKYFMGVDGQYKKLEVDDFYAKGGKTHEQGYDDREDESLAMRHGKISSKDFVGSHHKKEHSRRDDAHFETRDK